MTNEVVASAFHEENKNLKYIQKESEKVWKDKETGKFAQGEKSPFLKSVLVAGMGDLIPDVEFEKPKKKAAKKVENKAVKKSEDK